MASIKTCEYCGKEFSGGPNSRVCPDCKTQTCPCCGKKFKLTYHAREQIKKHGYATCSRSCGMKMSYERGDSKSEDGFARTCMICGKEFIGNSNNTWYCDECRVQPCIICGKPVELAKWRMSRFLKNGYITCGSIECSNALRVMTCKNAEGVDNPAQFAESRRKQSAHYYALSEEERQERVMRMVSQSRTPKSDKKRIGTMLELYGVEYGVQTGTCQERSHSKESRDKARQTMFETYGYGSNMERPEVKDKMHSPEAHERGRQTLFERQGVHSMLELDWVKEKANSPEARQRGIETSMRKYNRPYYLSNDTEQRIREYHESHPKASIGEVAAALGLAYSCVQLQNKIKSIGIPIKKSYFEDMIAKFLDELGIEYERRCRKLDIDNVGGNKKEVDFYIENKAVAIEVNDFLTHSVNYSPYGKCKPKRYHWDKTQMCAKSGVRLIHAWEHCLPNANVESGRLGSWEVLRDVIEHALGVSADKVYARNTKVVEFPAIQLKGFFNANNVNGYRNAKTAYCLVPKDVEEPTPDDVLMAYAIGRAHFGKGKYDAEIARGACKLGLTVVGGASKLWKHIIENMDYGSIVYYVDRNYYNADSMSFLDGVEYVGHSDSFWNYFPETGELRNREPKRHAEIKAGYEDGTIWQVYNAGTDTYVWHRKETE